MALFPRTSDTNSRCEFAVNIVYITISSQFGSRGCACHEKTRRWCMVRSLRLVISGAAGTAAVLIGSAGTLRAVDYSWNNAGGGTFSTAANWTPGGGPPAVGDKATFGLSTNY